VARKFKSEEDRFVEKHPYEVHLGGAFHARFTNLLTALHTAKEVKGSVFGGGESIEEHQVLHRFLSEQSLWEAGLPFVIQ